MLDTNGCRMPDARYQMLGKYLMAFIMGVGVLVSPVMTYAQTTSELPQVIAKLSIADFFSPFQPSIHIGLEHSLKGRWSWHHQAGYLLEILLKRIILTKLDCACGAACGFTPKSQANGLKKYIGS